MRETGRGGGGGRLPLSAPLLHPIVRQRLGGEQRRFARARARDVEAVLCPAGQRIRARATVAEVNEHVGARRHIERREVRLVHPLGEAAAAHRLANGAQ